MRVVLLAIVMSLTMALPVLSQKVEDGWKGLLPFKSTRADVEKVLGKGKENKDYWYSWAKQYEYSSDEAVISVVYAGAPCDEATGSFDRLDVPADTILRYDVQLNRSIPISEFTLEANRFVRDPDRLSNAKDSSYFYYYQAKEKLGVLPNESGPNYGIWFEGHIVEDREFVDYLHYRQPWAKGRSANAKSLRLLPALQTSS